MNVLFKGQEEPEKQPTFEDVELYQFFVDHDGDLCQKTADNKYQVIATSKGHPWSSSGEPTQYYKIKRILPKVDRIEF